MQYENLKTAHKVERKPVYKFPRLQQFLCGQMTAAGERLLLASLKQTVLK